jgi:hypothetical protein
MKLEQKVFLICGLILLFLSIFIVIYSFSLGNYSETKIVKCYDYNGNEIIGDKCIENKETNGGLFFIIGVLLFMMSILLIIISFFFKNLVYI